MEEPTGVESDTAHFGEGELQWFLKGWEYEIRSGHTAKDELPDEADERFNTHFPFDWGPRTEARLKAELAEWTAKFLAEEEARERTWRTTLNDQLSFVFEALSAQRLTALENTGCTLQDAWGYVGTQQRPDDVGAVVYSHLDVLDTLEGDELLISFGSFDPSAQWNESKAVAIGAQVARTLLEHGIPASWSGRADERIRVPCFEWQKRRWTPLPEVRPVKPAQTYSADVAPLLAVPATLTGEALSQYEQPVTAVRSSAGYWLQLATTYRGLWKKHGGVRGQMCHAGPPHIFVPAGEQTAFAVRNAYLNLPASEANAIRQEAWQATQAAD